MTRVLLGLSLVLALLFLAGCTPVRPWQRNTLAHRCMTSDSRPEEARARRHMLGARETTQGATGEAGGGCGCK
ncbi:MAG TPA: DUF4266 domain-containing protein [Polyangiaceae bacterium]|nr:DUF4266 domain-containing protein [Polyangiaceae bacterium]HMR78568.1 DUF4266 domain-containing protein [Polyangiaceae bacterium]